MGQRGALLQLLDSVNIDDYDFIQFTDQDNIMNEPISTYTNILFENPDIEFDDKAVLIRSNGRELDYRFADPKTIISPPEKDLSLPTVDVKFTLTAANLADIQKALGALGMPEIAVAGDGKQMWLQVTDSKNSQGDSYKINLGETSKKFHLVFKAVNLKFIPQDYEVESTSKGISHFKGSAVVDVDYWVMLEAKPSKYEG
jgi:hypothetical protein